MKKKNLPYTTQTFTVPFYQSKEISRLIWAARSQIDWCYNEGARQTLEDGQQGRFGLYGSLTEKRAEHDWLDVNLNIHRYAADGGRKAVEGFCKSNAVKRGMPKRKRKYTPPDSLFRKKKNNNGSQPAIGCYGHPAGRADGSWNLGGICNVVPKDASMKRDQTRSFQIIETTKKTTCRTLPEDRTYELHVQMHVAKPERSDDGDVIGADVGAVNMLAIHNLDKNTTVLATLPENATRYKNDDIDRRKSEQSRRKKGGNTWKKEQRRIKKKNDKVRNRRTDFMRKTVREEFADAGVIGVENLHPKQMARKGSGGKTGLNRVIKYAAIGEVLSYVEWFAEKHNKEFHKVRPHHTSTTCGSCGHSDRNSRRSQSIFVCVRCGRGDHADSNAGVNIAQRCAEAAGHVVVRRKEHMVPRTTKRGGAMQERTNQNASLPSEKDKSKHEPPPVAGVYYCI